MLKYKRTAAPGSNELGRYLAVCCTNIGKDRQQANRRKRNKKKRILTTEKKTCAGKGQVPYQPIL